LEEGTAVPAPALPSGSGDRVLDSIPPWGSGARAVAAWLIRLHGSRGIGEPEVVSGGRGPWRLGANALLLGAGERAALIATQSDPPPGEAVQAALVLHRLDAGGRTKRLALTGEADANGVDGTLAPAGRCVVVGGWTGVDAPAVWVVDLSAMAVRVALTLDRERAGRSPERRSPRARRSAGTWISSRSARPGACRSRAATCRRRAAPADARHPVSTNLTPPSPSGRLAPCPLRATCPPSA
jgi:hypothetical protein